MSDNIFDTYKPATQKKNPQETEAQENKSGGTVDDPTLQLLEAQEAKNKQRDEKNRSLGQKQPLTGRITILIDNDLKNQFKVITTMNNETMTDVLSDLITDYIKKYIDKKRKA